MKQLDLVTPGEILYEEFLLPLDITMAKLAADIHVAPNRISQIVKNMREITPDTALRLGKYFNSTPEFWLNLQMHYNLEKEKIREKEILKDIKQYQLTH